MSSKDTAEFTDNSIVSVDNENSNVSETVRLEDKEESNILNTEESARSNDTKYLDTIRNTIIKSRKSYNHKTCKDIAVQSVEKSITTVVITKDVGLDRKEHLERTTLDAETQIDEDLGNIILK